MMNNQPLMITVDGPSGSGKGSLAHGLARELKLNLLDSGAIYRLVAMKALRKQLDLDQSDQIVPLLNDLNIRFELGESLATPFLDEQDVSTELRDEKMGDAASRVARHVDVRNGLMALQRSFLTAPGLVADGRDMGTVVFPQASIKLYLYASAEIRAQRRYKQLINMGLSASIADLIADIEARDERDTQRSVSPLKPAEDAMIIDSSLMDLSQVYDLVLTHVRNAIANQAN